jgi:hypothetical protein
MRSPLISQAMRHRRFHTSRFVASLAGSRHDATF